MGNVLEILGPILPAFPVTSEEIHHIQQDTLEWKNHVWYDERYIYATSVADLTYATHSEESKLAKKAYLEHLRKHGKDGV